MMLMLKDEIPPSNLPKANCSKFTLSAVVASSEFCRVYYGIVGNVYSVEIIRVSYSPDDPDDDVH